jgi:JmjC domain
VSHSRLKTLATLIGPREVERFLLEYWEQRSFIAYDDDRTARHRYFSTLFSFDHVDQLLSASGPRFRDFFRLSVGGSILPREQYCGGRQDGLVDFDAAKILECYSDGATITINRAHQCSDGLARICEDLSREFLAHVNANVYVTPPYAQGFPAHSDNHDVLLLQIAGTKHWQIQRDLEYLATPRNPNKVSDASTVSHWDDVHLNPGDVLYLPRGLMHKGATGDVASIHATLGITGYLWADLVRDILAEIEGSETILRKPAWSPASNFTKDLSAVVDTLVSRLSAEDFVSQMMTNRTRTFRESRRGLFSSLAGRSTQITAETRFRVRDGLTPYVHLSNGQAILQHGSRSLVLPDYAAPHLQLILGSVVNAEGLPPDIDLEGRLTLLQRLHAERIIEVVQP